MVIFISQSGESSVAGFTLKRLLFSVNSLMVLQVNFFSKALPTVLTQQGFGLVHPQLSFAHHVIEKNLLVLGQILLYSIEVLPTFTIWSLRRLEGV
jgi:hypothetical protein